MAVKFTQEQLDYLASLRGMDEILNKIGAENTKKTLEYNKSENKLAKQSAGGSMGMNVAQGVLGLGQTIGGAKILKKTKPPKYPYELLPNKQLSARLADVQRLQQIGDPVIREKLLRDLVQQKMIADQSAKVASGGDVSAYGAQTQANQARLNDEIRNISASDLAYKTQQGGVLDNLIAQKVAEDKYAHQGRINKFNQLDYPEFAKKRAYGENLVNQGISNMFKSAQGGLESGQVMARTKENDRLFTGQERQAEREGKNIPLAPLSPLMNTTDVGVLGLGNIQPKPTLGLPIYGMPTDYSAYKDKVGKLTDEQILSGFENRINPLTKLPYNYTTNDVAKIRSGMTDGIYGDKHRVAQELLARYGY